MDNERVHTEKFKEEIVEEEFRQYMLRRTSAETINLDESKRPSYKPVNESFRKLAVDWVPVQRPATPRCLLPLWINIYLKSMDFCLQNIFVLWLMFFFLTWYLSSSIAQ